MKIWIGAIAGALMAAAGCQTQSPPPARGTSPSVLDVGPGPGPHSPSVYSAGYAPAAPAAYSAPAPAYLPPPPAPQDAPAPAVTVQPPATPAAPSAPPAAPAPKKSAKAYYVVKHGDTLYHIAREKYGDGKQWKRIADANPGVTPTTLKAGQKLVMP